MRFCRLSILFFVFFLGIVSLLEAQEATFFFSFSEENHSWHTTDAIETFSGDFVISAYDTWSDESVLLKLSSEGEILSKTIIVAEDTTIYACGLIRVQNENSCEYGLLCPSHPRDGSTAVLLFMRFDENLNITYRRAIPCAFFGDGDSFFDAEFLLLDTYIFGALTSKQLNSPNSIFLTKFDLDGNLLECQKWERDSLSSVCNLFHAEEDKIGLFARFSPSHMGFLTFDDSLQLISRDSISQWTNPEGGVGDFCLYHIGDMVNSQAAMLPDGSHLVSARLSENLFHPNGYLYKNDQSVILAKYENGFHQPDNMFVTEHMNDSVEYPAFHRSMDFRETAEMKCEVFQCSILNEFPQFGIQQPFPTGISVIKADRDLNVEWKRRYLRDGNYQAMAINATDDGGCLVVGSIGDYQAQRFDVFALKINADGIVGVDEIQEESMAFVYPNPAKEAIRIGGVEAKETMAYNSLGQCIMSFRGNEAKVEELSAGVYLLRITDRAGQMQTIRLVVDK